MSKSVNLHWKVNIALACALILTLAFGPQSAFAHHPEPVTDDPAQQEHDHLSLDGIHHDPSTPLMEHDAATADIISSGPSAKVIKNLAVAGRGERLVLDATTDVWAHDGYAYTGTFNNPCGGDPDAGIWIWDVHNPNKVGFVGVIPSPVGSRTNDVKVAALNSGDILVHSNEPCGGGPGGFEVYNVNDPANPVFLAHIQVDEINPITDFLFGGLSDNGVHNLWLFTQGNNDYVAAQSEGAFDGFQIFKITDPTNPVLVSGWGAEEVFDPGVGDETVDVNRVLNAALWLLEGFGASQNRFLHDFTITPDGTKAYLAHWDAGLILLDISDVSNPQLVSVAIDPTSEDGEVNSHSVWPSEDGTVVIEGEEDFAPFESVFTIDSGPSAGSYAATEGSITTPIVSLSGQAMSGSTTYVGLACTGGDPVPTGSGIALIQRGVCAFTDKINNAEAAGYAGVVVFNDEARGDALVVMGGTAVNLPGVFIGHSTGLSIAGATTATDLIIGAGGENITAAAIPNGWSGMRIWDYSDPANPVLASTFNTVCSATPLDPSCDPAGTYSSHNVVVETTGNQVKAYISWYWDGMVILDITDPYNPVETARFLDASTNGGQPNDFWGVYKEPNSPWIYGADRTGGLYVFKEFGSGSAKKGQVGAASAAVDASASDMANTVFLPLISSANTQGAVDAAGHGGSASPELNVVGQLDLNLPGENVTDVWAYGNYAYLGTFDDIACSLDWTGIHIVDISNPAAPTKVGFIPAKPGTRNNDVKVAHIETPHFSGEILIASNEACGSPFLPRQQSKGQAGPTGQNGITIWDVTDPTKPKALKQNFLNFDVHNTFIWQQGANAYVMIVDDENVQDVHIADITKPQSPKEIVVTGQLDWPDEIDAEFGATAGTFLHDIWVQENGDQIIAYLAYWDAGLVLLDVTDPAHPVFLGDSTYANPDPLSGEFPAGDGHVVTPNADGTRALLGDEDFAAGALTSFTFDGTEYPVAEGGFTPPVFSLPGATFGGPVHWTGGEGCTTAEFDRAATVGEVALIQRGTCFFSTKAANAQALGYSGFIVANNAGDGLIGMSAGTNDVITIPGFFVGQSTGEIMKGSEGSALAAAGIFEGYGYLRLLDVSDPANIVELDQFATEGVFANPPIPGDRTMHNVVVDDGTTAYISWYAEGMRVVDFAGDTLTEVAHFVDTENGSNFWGVYLHDHPNGNSYILGSDRNTGLWIFDTP